MNRSFTTLDLIRAHAMVKARIKQVDELAARLKAQHVADLEILDGKLMDALQDAQNRDGATKIATPAGTVYFKGSEKFVITDDEAFFNFLASKLTTDKNVRSLFTKTLSSPATAEYLSDRDKESLDTIRADLEKTLGHEPSEADIRMAQRERPRPTLPGVRRTIFEQAAIRKK